LRVKEMALLFKMRVISKQEDAGGINLRLEPVCPEDGEDDHENRRFWEATPSGSFDFYVSESAPAFEECQKIRVGSFWNLTAQKCKVQ